MHARCTHNYQTAPTIAYIYIYISHNFGILTHTTPRFRAVHEEVIRLDHDFGNTFSGVLADDAGRVRALWGSYAGEGRSDPS